MSWRTLLQRWSLLMEGFHDEAVRGQWENHRSSRLGLQYRVIYRVEERRVQVLMIDITAHDYPRK